MYKNKKKIMAVLITAMLITSLTACGKDTEEVIALDAETTEESSEVSEEIDTETEKPTLPYVEESGLIFTDETKVQTQGTLCIGNDTDNADIIDVDWELSNISISNTEDDVKMISIEQITYGYIWTDGDIFKTNLNLPSAMLCDINTGKIIPMTEEITTTEIEWENEKFFFETLETECWEDGDWSSEWVEDANGGERLASTLKVTNTIKVTKDYDGLALILLPITSVDNIVGSYIMDVWTDRSYLFSISDLSAKFEQIRDVQTAESEEGEEETKQEETESIEASKPKETTAPNEAETKTTHTHNYTSTISIQPTCTTNGQKVYVCSCGDSYTENIGTTAHDFSISVIQIVHHDAVYETIKRELPSQKIIICGCGAEFTSNDEWQAHCIANIEANGPFIACGGPYNVEERPGGVTYDYVEVFPAYDSEEIVGYKCSVCGATQ